MAQQQPQSPSLLAADGDHAMLSSRPAVMGYRCMACDRPLAALAERAGPWVPTGLMPAAAPPAAWDGQSGPGAAEDDGRGGASPAAARRRTDGVAVAAAAGADGRGPQAWFPDGRGAPAAELPGGLVGPHLPPGGWRGGQGGGARGADDGSLGGGGGALPHISKGRTPAASMRPTREG
jgi:hypothetical protein